MLRQERGKKLGRGDYDMTEANLGALGCTVGNINHNKTENKIINIIITKMIMIRSFTTTIASKSQVYVTNSNVIDNVR